MEDEIILPPRPPAPSDPEAAEYVGKQGARFEDHTKRNKANDPQFDFLALKRSAAENTPGADEPSPPGTSSSRKGDRRSRGDSADINEKESKKMRHASPPPEHSQSNGEGTKKKSSGDPRESRRDQEMKVSGGDPRQQRGDSRDSKSHSEPRHGDPRRQHGRDGESRRDHETKRHGDPRHEQHQTESRRREPGHDESGRDTERKRPRSPEQRKRNRSRSRSPPHRRNSRSPRRRSRSKSPMREHKRGDPRANAARSREICYDFSRGRCNKGPSCKYIHEEPDERAGMKRDEWGSSSHDRQRNSRDSREARDPRHSHSRDHPRDSTKDPREPVNKEVHAGHREHQREESQQGPSQASQQQSDWNTNNNSNNNFQSISQWPQSLSSMTSNTGYLQNGSIAASLQALQEQHFQLPPPPPPPPLAGLEALAVKVSAGPLVNPSGLFMEGHSMMQQESGEDGEKNDETERKSPENRHQGGDSDDNQNGEGEGEEESNQKKKASMMVRLAVTEYVKEVLKPTWKGGHLSKEVYKTIAKKAVDKVVGTLQGHQIPRTQEKVEHFMEFSRQKISKLVQGYVEKYNK